MKQVILRASGSYKELDAYMNSNGIRSFLLVCDDSLQYLKINSYFEELKCRTDIKVIKFSDFQPNPLYESVVKGVRIFRKSGCQNIVAVGGGSAIDVAKCIKLYSSINDEGLNGICLKRLASPDNVRMLAVPTTAGTGSEATRYAVIYHNGEKLSISHESIIPDTVLIDSSVLDTLPLYQKKSTVLDALCHGIESFWSVNSTDVSREYSLESVSRILESFEKYLAEDHSYNEKMLYAAHIAGKAINIAQTTAGHAMCYKLTSLYGIAHGHAAALCVKELWPWMIDHMDRCADVRGKTYLASVFKELAQVFGCRYAMDGALAFQSIVDGLKLDVPMASDTDFMLLKNSVNPVRLKNNPVTLNESGIVEVYCKILMRE